MEQEKIICPNCGAENDYGGTCKYCGGLLHAQSNISVGDELEDQPISLNDEKYKYFSEEFDRIEKITWSRRGYLASECSSSGKKRVFIVRSIECSDGLPQALVFNLHGKIYRIDRERYIVYNHETSLRNFRSERLDTYKVRCYKLYFEINANILKELCEVSGELEIKILFPNTNAQIFKFNKFYDQIQIAALYNYDQIAARLFYNKLFDDSAYLETLMDFQKKEDEKEEEEKKRQEKAAEELKRKKEEQQKQLEEHRLQRLKWVKEEREKRRKKCIEEREKEEERERQEMERNLQKGNWYAIILLIMFIIVVVLVICIAF